MTLGILGLAFVAGQDQLTLRPGGRKMKQLLMSLALGVSVAFDCASW
jgi:hypothetical protein